MVEFTYNASALGAGGVVRRNGVETIIPSIASVALAPTGGAGRSVVNNYCSEELSFTVADTRVSGSESGGTYTTQTYVYIKDLRVFDSLEIGEMLGVVTSMHSDVQDDDHEFRLEASYRDVRVAGQEVIPALDVCVGSLKRYRHLGDVLDPNPGLEAVRAGVKRPDTPQALLDLVDRFGAKTAGDLRTLVNEGRALHGSLVAKVDGAVQARHHEVPVPRLGKVRFGELMFKPGRRRVNLLRIALGNDGFGLNNTEILAPGGGSLTIASVEGNGTPVHP
jgi:hypothetical protein